MDVEGFNLILRDICIVHQRHYVILSKSAPHFFTPVSVSYTPDLNFNAKSPETATLDARSASPQYWDDQACSEPQRGRKAFATRQRQGR